MDQTTTTVTILNRKYRLKISAEESDLLLSAAELIDSQARKYGKIYGYQDQQDLLAMVALTQITQMTRKQKGALPHDTKLLEQLEALDNRLDKALKKTPRDVTES